MKCSRRIGNSHSNFQPLSIKPSLISFFIFLASGASIAGILGADDPQFTRATGFPGAFITSTRLAMEDDSTFDSRLLDAMQLHLKSIAAMTVPSAIANYLESASTGGQGLNFLREKLGKELLDPPKLAALVIADALFRPDQFDEIVVGLETVKAGLGKQSILILKATRGVGHKGVIAALRMAGDRSGQVRPRIKNFDTPLRTLFEQHSSDSHTETPSRSEESLSHRRDNPVRRLKPLEP